MNMSQAVSILCAEQALPSYIDSLMGTSVFEPEESPEKQNIAPVPDTIMVMLFQAAGITFAIETKNITIITTTKSFAHLDRESAYFDLTKLLDPGVCIQNDDESCLSFIHVKHLEFPLLCDFVGEIVSVSQSSINWRTSEGKRKWLAGTVPDLKCAILDVPELQLLTTKMMSRSLGQESAPSA